MKILVYGKTGCQPCTATKRWLDEREILFTPLDITMTENRVACSYLGYAEAPVIVITGESGVVQHWSGFRPDKLDELLRGNPQK